MSKKHHDSLPFDGAVSKFFETEAPKKLRKRIEAASKNQIVSDTYPYTERMPKEEYEHIMAKLQIELVKFQSWVRDTKSRVVIVFEGRDASGKGGTIKRFRENLNPRRARVVALTKPSDRERTQFYFQRYMEHMPAAGEIVLFDRSWYNRAVVEKVFGFCEEEERERFFQQVPGFERALVEDGIFLYKLWLNVGQGEQIRRFLDRERDPLKQWKLSEIDVEGLRRWDSYSSAIQETFARSHRNTAPWTIVRSDDKRRARIAAIRHVLSSISYTRQDVEVAALPDHLICGGPDIWHA
ncbi:MAG: polyphosphate kinase 2 [Mangrovicoccus sp.]|nr:polyphosphate kinase 2 [Mangrovicoccus sp.]